jgi:hypothetical protein
MAYNRIAFFSRPSKLTLIFTLLNPDEIALRFGQVNGTRNPDRDNTADTAPE